MAHIQYRNPWNAGYAIPKYVLAEPQGRGVFVTKQLPRGTISQVPHGLHRGGYQVPKYARRLFGEDPLTTKMLPRRTVDALAPDIFGRPTAVNSKGPVEELIATGSVLAGSSLGNDGFAPGTRQDPILNYGKQGAAWIMREVRKLPRGQRVSEIRKLLRAVDANLPGEVEKKAELYKKKGHKPKDAFQRALAASLSNHMVAEFVRLGKGERPDPLGSVYAELGGFWSTIATPFKYIGKGVKATGSLTVKGVKKLGGLTCGVAKSPVGLIAGGATGGVAGAAGVQVVAGACPSGTAPIQPAPESGFFGASGFPVLPVALAAGGALILIVALK